MLAVASTAQTFDDVIASRRYINCQDVTFNAVTIISDLYARHRIDSIYLFTDYWESKCAPMPSTITLRRILDIRSGRFSPDSITPLWIEELVAYKQRMAYKRHWRGPDIYVNDFFRQHERMDSLSRRMAAETLSDNIDARLLLDFYSADSVTFEKINAAPADSRLGMFYRERYRQVFRSPLAHWAFITGLVQNYGRISIFGNRPNFGVALGSKWLRHNCDIILDFRAGPSKEDYSFVYNDSLISGHSWTGMYVGLEYTFDFIHTAKLDVGISPGIGYDRITALTTDNDYGEDPLFLGSFNKNVGIVIKYKFGKTGGYLGWHLRYNWVDYKNPGGTPLEGHYLNIRLTIGSLWDYFRQSRLESLE